MTTALATPTATSTRTALLLRGVGGGLAGGLAFGLLMQMMGMMPMVAMLVGSDSTAVGWLLHLAISAFIGATFGVLLGRRVTSIPRGLGLGVGYGILWWVLGALIIMPASLGMPIFAIGGMSLQSLMGHMLFGAVLGAVVALSARAGRA